MDFILPNAKLVPVAKLLLNAWSAEYALRLTPLLTGEEDIRHALNWTLPQGYYSTLFMIRAFLAARGNLISDERGIELEVDNLIHAGVYDYDPYQPYQWKNREGKNFMAALADLRLSASNPTLLISPQRIVSFHPALVAQVEKLNAWHERKIRLLVGPPAYAAIVDQMPSYLVADFIGKRYQELVHSRLQTTVG